MYVYIVNSYWCESESRICYIQGTCMPLCFGNLLCLFPWCICPLHTPTYLYLWRKNTVYISCVLCSTFFSVNQRLCRSMKDDLQPCEYCMGEYQTLADTIVEQKVQWDVPIHCAYMCVHLHVHVCNFYSCFIQYTCTYYGWMQCGSYLQ